MDVYTFCTPSHKALLERFLLPSATQAGFKVHITHTEQQGASGMYLEQGWMETMQQKIELLLEVSLKNQGIIFIYSDCDIVFNHPTFNPQVALKDFGTSEFIAFQDDVVQKCAGFMILKGGPELEKFLRLTLESLSTYGEDQTTMNAIISRLRVPITILPQQEYFCIRQQPELLNEKNIWNEQSFALPPNWKIFHANWTHGVAMKEQLLTITYESTH